MLGTDDWNVLKQFPIVSHVVTQSDFPGVEIIKLDRFEDERGWLTVDWSGEGTGKLQIYHSLTHTGHARDEDVWHVHQKQTDRFVALQGTAVFALSDGRYLEGVIMSAYDPVCLVIPPGICHCFRVLGTMVPFMLLNFPTHLYDPEDEGRVPFYGMRKMEVDNPW